MNKRLLVALAVAGGSLLMATQATAVAVKLAPGTAAPPVKVTDAVPAPVGGQPTLDLASGRIDAVVPDKRQIQVAGKLLEWDAKKLRVVGVGGYNESSVSSLRKGTQIRYALDPSAKSGERLIVLIYIDKP
jgi:hypothetical protein